MSDISIVDIPLAIVILLLLESARRALRRWSAGRRACRHEKASIREFFRGDTPFIDFYCPACHFRDRGPVMTDPATWAQDRDET